MHLPFISIIILHYKNLADTRECLKSLQKMQYPQFSVILVNNDILEHKTVLQAEYGDFVKIIQNKQNMGFSEGNNVGIRHALADPKTDAILLLNNDTVVEPDFLKEMVKLLQPSPYPSPLKGEGIIGMAAPCTMQYHDRTKVDNLGIVLMSSGLPFNRTSERQKLFCPSGGCALYARELLETVAIHQQDPHPNPLPSKGEGTWYFDPLFFSYCEDLDLGWRARLLGFEAGYAKDAVVYHKGSASSSKLSDFAVYNTYRNLIWTQYKNYPVTLFLRHVLWLILGWKLLIFGYVLKGRPRVIARALFDGIRGISTMKQKRAEIQKTKRSREWNVWFEKGLFPKNLFKY